MKTKPLYIVINTDGSKKEFHTDEAFLKYAREIYTENESGQPYPSEIHWLPENVQQAKEYLIEYCNLNVIEL